MGEGIDRIEPRPGNAEPKNQIAEVDLAAAFEDRELVLDPGQPRRGNRAGRSGEASRRGEGAAEGPTGALRRSGTCLGRGSSRCAARHWQRALTAARAAES